MNAMILPIKEPWFSMIQSGEKKEEYREIKPYYTSRLANLFEVDRDRLGKLLTDDGCIARIRVLFRHGYSKASPSFTAECSLKIGTGRQEWGAEPGKEYYVFTILTIDGTEIWNEDAREREIAERVISQFKKAQPPRNDAARQAKDSLEDFFTRNRKVLLSAGAGMYVNEFGDMEYGGGEITNQMIDDALEQIQILYESAGGTDT